MRALAVAAILLLAVGCTDESTDGDGTTTAVDGGDSDTVGTDGTDDVGSRTDVDLPDAGGDVGPGDVGPGDVGTGDTDGTDGADAQDVGEPDAPDATEVMDNGPPVELCAQGVACDDDDPCTADDTCGEDHLCVGTPYVCDDGRTCTNDVCDGSGDCDFLIAEGSCLINNVCYGPGDAHIQNPCVVCNPTNELTEWSLANNGSTCGDDDACLTAGACQDGQCDADAVGCNDDNACTDDFCAGAAGCVFVPNYDPCSDGDACTLGDACAFGNCKPGIDTLHCDDGEPCTNDVCGPEGCLALPKAGACEDGTQCTVGDFCEKGECKSGELRNCEDGNICTTDACDPFIACVYEPVESACCNGGVSLCDDGDSCTADQCDEDQGTCVYTPSNAPCDDGDTCTGPDKCTGLNCGGPALSCDDSNACTTDSCDAQLGGCQHQATAGTCDDGNSCTTSDGCNGGTCLGTPLNCNDSNPCTTDSCDPLTGCNNTILTGPCDDGNACTQNTVCSTDGCKGELIPCSDGNQCTNDSCHPSAGCQFQPLGGPCDDSLACSTGDACQSGQCVSDTSECGCIPQYGDVVSKLTKFNIGKGGQPGQALDVDDDPTTCAPSSDCSGGLDNQLAAFASLANDALDDTLADGGLVLLFDHFEFKSSGLPYTLTFWPADTLKGSTCDVQSETCNYELKSEGFDAETCEPLIGFDNARIIGGNTLEAGGAGYKFPFEIPLSGAVITMTLENARIEADVTIAGGKVVAMNGVLAGAVAKETFIEAIDQLDASELPDGVSKEQIIGLIQILIQNDVDSNGDGADDSASIGLLFNAIGGNITQFEIP
ncbi:MAG: hypothetical protein ACI9OJ_004686 [Myxococcota bacterium]|jgi:hypothetical protein